MIRVLKIQVLLLCFAPCCGGAPFVFDPGKNLSEVGWSYFAPMTMHDWRARLPDRTVREFHYDRRDESAVYIMSPDGWSGMVKGMRADIVPSSRDRDNGAVQRYRFENGRLVSILQGGKERRFKYPEIVPNPGEVLPELWDGYDAIRPEDVDSHDLWKGSGRFRWFYRNPNCMAVLLAELAVLALALILCEGRWCRIHGLLLLANLLTALSMTKSRGALLGLGVAALFLVIFKVRGRWRMTGKRIASLVLVLLVLAGIAFFGYRDRFAADALNRQSDVIRFESWDRVPEMIVSAPWGWNYPFAGMPYVNWFQDLDRYLSVKDMMNEHLSFLVMHGWPIRIGYLFMILLAIVLLGADGWRRRNACGLGLLTVYLITSSLNRTFESPSLVILPVVGFFWTFLQGFRERGIEFLRRPVFAAAILSTLLSTSVFAVGSVQSSRRHPSVSCDGRRILVGGPRPDHWIVDDGTVLNAHYVGKEVRRFFTENPSAPSVGYVQTLDDLPQGTRHVVLFGKSCAGFIERCCRNPEAVDCATVTFISPTVAPADIPENLRTRFGIEVYLGVFLAQTLTDDGCFPSWVHVVPAAERYLPGWMEIVVMAKKG